MLNGDVLTDLDLTAQLAQHERTGARATLALYPVEDPSAYGLVRLDDDGAVTEFVEKPAPDQIDTQQHLRRRRTCSSARCSTLLEHGRAGLDRARRLPAAGRRRPVRLRRARLLDGHRDARALPAGDVRHPRGHRRAPRSPRGWADATCASRTASRTTGGSSRRRWSRRGCRIGEGARIGGRAVLEHGVSVGEGTTIERSVVMRGRRRSARTARCAAASSRAGVRIGDHCVVDGHERARRGRRRSAPATSSPTARGCSPASTLPDGALLF